MAGRTVLLIGLAALVAGCGFVRDTFGVSRSTTDLGLPYRASLEEGAAGGAFTVIVAANGATLGQARESARYPATVHCLGTTGFSDVDWVTDPATGDWAVRRTADGGLIVQGRCEGRA